MATPDLGKINFTPEEARNMTKLMKDPKFMDMFADYANEISDPKNRQEMETALKEAEKRGEKVPGFPEGKELLIPYAAFCTKTKQEETGMKDQTWQVFINICHSDKIGKATSYERPDKSGTDWDIPYSLATPIKDKDKGGVECDVHDFVINTETHKLAMKEHRFKKFLVETAIDAIEKNHHLKLSRDFTLPRLKYQGSNGEPRMHTISKVPNSKTPRTTAKGEKGKKMQSASELPNSVPSSNSRSKQGTPGDLPASSNSKENPQSMNDNMNSKYLGKLSNAESNAESISLPKLTLDSTNSPVIPDWNEDGLEKPSQEVEPKYKVVYRNHLDLAQFWEDKTDLKFQRDEVKEIILHVHLPGVVNLSDIKLDVTQSEVAVVVPGKFNLKVHLKHQVDPARGQAKFDRERPLYQLEITLPVLKSMPRVEHDKDTLMM